MRLFAAVLFCSTAALAERAGLYPLQLPHGDAQLAARLAEELPALLPMQPAYCAPDEQVCLAGAARMQGLQKVVSAAVQAAPAGYQVHVRAFTSDEKLLGEWQGEGDDLGALLRRGVCASLGCELQASVPREALGEVTVAQSRTRVEVGLFAGGLGLLAAAAGVGLYAQVSQSSASRTTALTASRPAGTPSAGTFAIALAATGLGAIAAGGLVIALTPESATLQARF